MAWHQGTEYRAQRSVFARTITLIQVLSMVACHVHTRVEETIPGERTLRPWTPAFVVALDPIVTLEPDGTLLLSRELRCRNDVLIKRDTYHHVTVSPNFATMVVGILGISVGALTLIVGGGASNRDASTALGGSGILAGVPLALGPFFGNHSFRTYASSDEQVLGIRWATCGSRPVHAGAAVVHHGTRRIGGHIDEAGRFSVALFEFVDAFRSELPSGVTLAVATSDGRGGTTTINSVIDPSDLVSAQPGFLRTRDIDAQTPRLTKAPGLSPSSITITRVRTQDDRRAVQITIAVNNSGPGPVFGVRAQLVSTHPQIDGRMLYIGALPAHAAVEKSIVVELEGAAVAEQDDEALAQAMIAFTLRDAHNTVADVPMEFRGPVLNSLESR